tara:strand:+ start:617 stop:778 length:162 start_codon:yes stop_codon:yes gene_type:complete
MIFVHENEWAIHHNAYLAILAHSGLVGVLLFMVCIFIIFTGVLFLNTDRELSE